MKAVVVTVGSFGAVLIKKGSVIPDWMIEALTDAQVEVTNPLSADLLYPMIPSIDGEDLWDVESVGSFESFAVGADVSDFLRG
jgi:hypothetical protein